MMVKGDTVPVNPADFLEAIIAAKRRRIAQRAVFLKNIRENVAGVPMTRYGIFRQSIAPAGRVALIAEIKRASPSKGILCQDFGVSFFARVYKEGGAAALSVLTEEDFFMGRPDYVRLAAEFQLPVLAKDFFIDELQIYEAYSFGASAILLIATILTDDVMRRFLEIAQGLDMDCLVEVHTADELKRACDCGATLIGINNRDLRTFAVDLAVSDRLLPLVPSGCVRVVESGIRSREDVSRVAAAGANAVLIGEALVASSDIVGAMRQILGPDAPRET